MYYHFFKINKLNYPQKKIIINGSDSFHNNNNNNNNNGPVRSLVQKKNVALLFLAQCSIFRIVFCFTEKA
ncbi:MAG: hypothetical protein N7Q72_06715, partial [Spiroplasma sp. Tabriz.8]|nr:hypothetical protein [Spiroplasma sp. Tabriz.8]